MSDNRFHVLAGTVFACVLVICSLFVAPDVQRLFWGAILGGGAWEGTRTLRQRIADAVLPTDRPQPRRRRR